MQKDIDYMLFLNAKKGSASDYSAVTKIMLLRNFYCYEKQYVLCSYVYIFNAMRNIQ